jgi:hypothetical protein
LIAVDPREPQRERAAFLVLAELAKEQTSEFLDMNALVNS